MSSLTRRPEASENLTTDMNYKVDLCRSSRVPTVHGINGIAWDFNTSIPDMESQRISGNFVSHQIQYLFSPMSPFSMSKDARPPEKLELHCF